MSLVVRRVGPEGAAAVLAVVRPAFGARPPVDPPAPALTETEDSMAELLGRCGGLVASLDGADVGALVLDPVGSTMYLRRFGVLPSAQGHGVAARLIDAAVAESQEFDDLTVVAREELPETVRFWERQGFREILRDPPNVELRRPLRTFLFDVPDPESMRDLGSTLAGQLGGGDLLVLSGELGAGKTTFTQGIGAGLQVRGQVTSPTFVIAREHPSLVGGPPLVHVDAYRLGGIDELDDLDLDTSLDEAVTVVEWGEGIAEGLAESRLEVRIVRALAHEEEHVDLDPRRVLMTPVGPRWHDLRVPASERPPLAEKHDEDLLLDFRPGPEADLDGLDPAVAVERVVVVAVQAGRVLVTRRGQHDQWALPAGAVGAGESAAAAVRGLLDGTGSKADGVEHVGVGTVQRGPERRIEYVALHRAEVVDAAAGPAYDPEGVTWWDPTTNLDGLSPIDAHLARLALGQR